MSSRCSLEISNRYFLWPKKSEKGLIGRYQVGTDFWLNSAKLDLSTYCLRVDQAISGYSGLLILQDSKGKCRQIHGRKKLQLVGAEGPQEPSLIRPLSSISSVDMGEDKVGHCFQDPKGWQGTTPLKVLMCVCRGSNSPQIETFSSEWKEGGLMNFRKWTIHVINLRKLLKLTKCARPPQSLRKQ